MKSMAIATSSRIAMPPNDVRGILPANSGTTTAAARPSSASSAVVRLLLMNKSTSISTVAHTTSSSGGPMVAKSICGIVKFMPYLAATTALTPFASAATD